MEDRVGETDESGSAHHSELRIDKDLERVSAGEIGFSVEDGKTVMAHLQPVVVNQRCEASLWRAVFCAPIGWFVDMGGGANRAD